MAGNAVPGAPSTHRLVWPSGAWSAAVLAASCVYPYRFWGSFGPISTFTLLDVVCWGIVVGSVLHPSGRILVGARPLLAVLLVPVVATALSLPTTLDQVSTLKAMGYSATGVVGYLAAVNSSGRIGPRRIEQLWAFFVIASVGLALLYWAKVPVVWRLLGASFDAVAGLDPWAAAAAFARLDSPLLGRSNDFAAVLSPFMFLFIGGAIVKRDRLLTLAAVAAATGIVLTLSRGVILVVVFLLLVGLIRQGSIRGWLGLGTVAVLVVAILIWFVGVVQSSGIDLVESRRDAANVESRLERWEYGWQVARAHPLTGAGAGRHIPHDPVDVKSAVHNTYIEQLAAFGLPLGTLVVASLVSIPFLLRSHRDGAKARTLQRWARLGGLSFLLACLTQTQNEAAVPSLMFRVYLGVAAVYLAVASDPADREPVKS